MKEGNLYRPSQELYQMKPGRDFGDSNSLVTVKQDSYEFKKKGSGKEMKRAAGGPLGSAAAVPMADDAALRNSSNMPAMKRGGMMKNRKDHARRRV
jgi:hypothetical protein